MSDMTAFMLKPLEEEDIKKMQRRGQQMDIATYKLNQLIHKKQEKNKKESELKNCSYNLGHKVITDVLNGFVLADLTWSTHIYTLQNINF